MPQHVTAPILRSIRLWLTLFIIGLVLSGLTAFPLDHELAWLATFTTAHPFLPRGILDWITRVHFALAVAFIGPFRDPVRNKWVIQFGLVACAAVPLLAFIAGPIRGIPLYWRLIDSSFGLFGCIPLLIAFRKTIQLEQTLQSPQPAPLTISK